MQLKTFHAPNMKAAMELVREALGDEAVILSTQKEVNGKGVTIIAACEPQDEPMPLEEEAPHLVVPAPRPVYNPLPDYLLRDVEQALRWHGVDDTLTGIVLARLGENPKPKDDSPESLAKLLGATLSKLCKFSPLPYLEEPMRLILIGAPGAGKTSLTAKMAARLVKAGKKAAVISTDHKRAGGIEQLAAFTDILGIELQVAANRMELKGLLSDYPPELPVLIDSAGANPYEFQALKELAEFAGLMSMTPVLVFPAGGDPQEAAEIAEAFSFLGVGHIMVTRLDLARRYGSIVTAAYAAGLALSHMTGSEKVLGDFEEANPLRLAQLLIQYRKDTV